MKRKKLRTFKITNPVYQYIVFIRIGGTVEEAEAWFFKKFEIAPENRGATASCCHARTLFFDNERSHVIWFDSLPGAGVVSHEAFHSVNHVLRHCGVKAPMEYENEEIWAYLLTWTVQQIGGKIW